MRQRQQNHQASSFLTLPLDSHTSSNSSVIRALVLQRNILVALCILLMVMLLSQWGARSIFSTSMSSPTSGSETAKKNACDISLGEYRGPVYHSVESGTIGESKCLVGSKWMQVSLHTVQFPGSDATYDDWLWIDYHDRINVLVEDSVVGEDESRFLVFEQTKYALEGRKSLAIVGGIIEPGT